MSTPDPENYRLSTPTYIALYGTLLTAYYVYVNVCPDRTMVLSFFVCSWDTSMSQKSRFKMQTQGITTFRKTFPQLPGGTLANPKFIQTAHGNRLLVDGWWAYSRKPVRALYS